MRIIQRPPVKKRTRRIMNVFSKLKRKIRQKIAVSKSNTIPASSSEQHNSTFKLQLVNLRLYSEEVDSLFCVTVVSDHLVCPNKGLPVTVDIDKDTMEVTWVDKNSNSHVLCSHPLHTITYQFHTSFKPRLYGYTATWGNKKICLVFQAPLFSRIKGIKIRQYYDKMLQCYSVPHVSKSEAECNLQNAHFTITTQERNKGVKINTRTRKTHSVDQFT